MYLEIWNILHGRLKCARFYPTTRTLYKYYPTTVKLIRHLRVATERSSCGPIDFSTINISSVAAHWPNKGIAHWHRHDQSNPFAYRNFRNYGCVYLLRKSLFHLLTHLFFFYLFNIVCWIFFFFILLCDTSDK